MPERGYPKPGFSDQFQEAIDERSTELKRQEDERKMTNASANSKLRARESEMKLYMDQIQQYTDPNMSQRNKHVFVFNQPRDFTKIRSNLPLTNA